MTTLSSCTCTHLARRVEITGVVVPQQAENTRTQSCSHHCATALCEVNNRQMSGINLTLCNNETSSDRLDNTVDRTKTTLRINSSRTTQQDRGLQKHTIPESYSRAQEHTPFSQSRNTMKHKTLLEYTSPSVDAPPHEFFAANRWVRQSQCQTRYRTTPRGRQPNAVEEKEPLTAVV